MGVRISRPRREAIYERDSWSCHICRLPVRTDRGTGHPQAPSLDHLVPRSRGGKTAPETMRTAHSWCNAIRGNEPVAAGVPRWAAGGPPDDWKHSRAVLAQRLAEQP